MLLHRSLKALLRSGLTFRDIKKGKLKMGITHKTSLLRRRTVSKVLSILAFLLNLLWKDYLGTLFAILIGASALFVFLETVDISRICELARLEGIEHAHSITAIMVFLMGATLTKLVVPIFVQEDFFLACAITIVYLSSFLVAYKLWDRTIWKRYKQAAKSSLDVDRLKEYNRVTNSILLLCLLISTDGADLMFLLNIFVSFIHEILLVTEAIKSVIIKLSTISIKNKAESRKPRYYDRGDYKDFEDQLWKRPHYTRRFLKGVPLLLFAFIGCLPFVVFSYKIELFSLNLVVLLGMIALSSPGIVAILVVDIPWRVGKGRGTRLRKNALLLSFLPPILMVVASTLYPLPEFAEPIPAWLMVSITAAFGLPLLQGVIRIEQSDYKGIINWFRTLGISSSFLILVANVYGYRASVYFSGFLSPVFIMLTCICLFFCSVIYLVFRYGLVTQFVEGFKEIEKKEVDYWIDYILTPRLNFDTFASLFGIGILQGLLSLFLTAIGGLLVTPISIFFWFLLGWATTTIFRLDRSYHCILPIVIFQLLGCFVSFASVLLSMLASMPFSTFQMLGALGYLLALSGLWATPSGTICAFWLRRKKYRQKQSSNALTSELSIKSHCLKQTSRAYSE